MLGAKDCGIVQDHISHLHVVSKDGIRAPKTCNANMHGQELLRDAGDTVLVAQSCVHWLRARAPEAVASEMHMFHEAA